MTAEWVGLQLHPRLRACCGVLGKRPVKAQSLTAIRKSGHCIAQHPVMRSYESQLLSTRPVLVSGIWPFHAAAWMCRLDWPLRCAGRRGAEPGSSSLDHGQYRGKGWACLIYGIVGHQKS